MEDAVTGKRLEEILAEQGLSTGFVYGAPQDESWDGVVDREIKLEPKARTKWLMDSLFYQSFSTANTEFPYWYTRKFEECDGDVLEVRRAKGAGPALMRIRHPLFTQRTCFRAGRPVICAEDFQCPG